MYTLREKAIVLKDRVDCLVKELKQTDAQFSKFGINFMFNPSDMKEDLDSIQSLLNEIYKEVDEMPQDDADDS